MSVETILAAKGREVRTVAPDATVGEALRRMRDERVGALVVSADGTAVAGIVSDRDVLHAVADRAARIGRPDAGAPGPPPPPGGGKVRVR